MIATVAAADDVELLAFADAGAWEAWLAEHHDSATDAWLRIARKGSTEPGISIDEALDVALSFGWIDSHRRAGDGEHYRQRYSPRRAASPWSQVNVEKAEALIAAGRMREPGFTAIAAAQADGRWDAAYERQRTATIPDDLAAALADEDAARRAFDALDRTARYALFLRLMKARTPTIRARERDRIVDELRG